MKLLSWNSRGINSLKKIKILCQKIKMTNLAIVFLQETKCLANYIQDHRGIFWARCESMGIDLRGFSGGLCILWDPTRASLSDFQGTHNLISANFKVVCFLITGLITDFYGLQKVVYKRNFLKSLINMREHFPSKH